MLPEHNMLRERCGRLTLHKKEKICNCCQAFYQLCDKYNREMLLYFKPKLWKFLMENKRHCCSFINGLHIRIWHLCIAWHVMRATWGQTEKLNEIGRTSWPDEMSWVKGFLFKRSSLRRICDFKIGPYYVPFISHSIEKSFQDPVSECSFIMSSAIILTYLTAE